MIYFAFPHKVSSDGELKNGSLFQIPSFCSQHCNSNECKKHYLDLSNSHQTFKVCPFGFGSSIISLDETTTVVLTCLNVESLTKKKFVLKKLKERDFLPRLSLSQYNSIVENSKKLFFENKTSNVKLLELEKSQEQVGNQKVLLENTLHELRKINAQLKSAVELFTAEYNKDRGNFELLKNLCTDIYATSNLLSIRFDTYDLEVNPNLNMSVVKSEIPIYKRIEKIYKCLSNRLNKRQVRLRLEGNSYKKFYASNVIEIALFIIIENATKYAMPNTDIIIKFDEDDERLKVKFINWGIRPSPNEIQHLTERGFRSQIVLNTKSYEGRGIGLYLFKRICENEYVAQKITIGSDFKAFEGYMYAPFIVEMTLKNLID